jgi:hypothetical protein
MTVSDQALLDNADEVLKHLDYITMKMLQRFRDSPSFLAVAVAVQRDERVVSRRLLELSQAMNDAIGVPLLESARGRRGWTLSKEGEYFAARIDELLLNARESVAALASSDTLRVPCGSTCLPYFQRLQRGAAVRLGVDVRPDPRRSAEFPAPPEKLQRTVVQGGDYGLSYFTVATDRADRFTPHRRALYQDAWEVLPIQTDDFKVLARSSLQLPAPLTFDNLLDLGISIWIPAGGAAWQFAQLVSPGWEKKFPLQFHQTPDFEFGVQCLTREIQPRDAVMIVHSDAIPRPMSVDDEYWLRAEEDPQWSLQLVEFDGSNERAVKALTGLFCHTEPNLTTDERAKWTQVWELSPNVMFA